MNVSLVYYALKACNYIYIEVCAHSKEWNTNLEDLKCAYGVRKQERESSPLVEVWNTKVSRHLLQPTQTPNHTTQPPFHSPMLKLVDTKPSFNLIQYGRFIAGPTLNNSKKKSWFFFEIITWCCWKCSKSWNFTFFLFLTECHFSTLINYSTNMFWTSYEPTVLKFINYGF